jgi:hypothetical protein
MKKSLLLAGCLAAHLSSSAIDFNFSGTINGDSEFVTNPDNHLILDFSILKQHETGVTIQTEITQKDAATGEVTILSRPVLHTEWDKPATVRIGQESRNGSKSELSLKLIISR